MRYAKMIFAALVTGAAIAGCSSGPPATVPTTAPPVAAVPTTAPPVAAVPTTAPPVVPALHTWGETVALSDGATLAVSQPVRDGSIVSYRVTVHNQTAMLLTNVSTALTVDGLAVDNGETIDNDPGYQLGVAPNATLTYTVHRTKVPATGRTITLTIYVNFSNGAFAVDRPVWVGEIK